MNKIERMHMNEQAQEIRKNNFLEVSNGFDYDAALTEASRCLNCKNAPCVKGCPVGIDIPAFISLIKDGKILDAALKILETNSLPAICGRVCPQEEQCEKNCVRKKMEGSVSIGGLERFCADHFLSLKNEKQIVNQNQTGKKVAVVGSGPSGLACAAELAKNGVEVEVFEALNELGGVLVYGIPEFRLPKSLVKQEVENLENLGVKFHKNVIIGKSLFMEEILNDYDAVFLGSGAGLPSFLKIKGENLRGVSSANEYLTRINLMKAYKEESDTPVKKGGKVVVIGGGNVAMDAARTALRLGGEVTIVYRRGLEEMPARKEEVRHAIEEGINFNVLTSPVEILGQDGKVEGIKCIKMELGEPDQSGRRSPIEIPGSIHQIECDQVIVAVGTSPNPILKNATKGLETTKRGTFVVNEETLETTLPNVYAGGDAVTGAATVILAMGAGKKAASAILSKINQKN